jgi:hypothetical protein
VRFRKSVRSILVVALLAIASATQSAEPRRVLFIGNSLTAANNLPAMVEAIARQGGETIVPETVAFPDFSLEDHWMRGDAVRAVRRGGWFAIVLQQGPSALPESRVNLIEYARKFDGEARKVGAKTALYMVWPGLARPNAVEGVRQSYAKAASEVGGLLLPAGEAWRAAWRRDGSLTLYGSDGFHPSPLGTYLAALVIYQRLTGRSPVGLPSSLNSSSGAFPSIALSAARAALLQSAAVEANARR